jgi:hypothetical protein
LTGNIANEWLVGKLGRGFFHPNVYYDGELCLSILSPGVGGGWRHNTLVREILLGIQELIKTPNPLLSAQDRATILYVRNRPEYNRVIRDEVVPNAPDPSGHLRTQDLQGSPLVKCRRCGERRRCHG